jgi:putative methyltransferase (TIGR04325 family)
VTVRELLRQLLPPVVVAMARRLRGGGRAIEPREWQLVPEGWAYGRSHPEVKGWDVASVLAMQRERWPRFVALLEANGPLGISHESDLSDRGDLVSHNTIMTFAYVLGLVTHLRERVSFLDWGGGLGHYYLLARQLQPGVGIEYHCKELPLLAQQGARLFPDQHFTSDERCLARTYDFVMASTSLQYEEDWCRLLARLARATAGLLYVTGLPVVEHAASFVFVQRPYPYGYDTEYLAWCLNRDEFLTEAVNTSLALVREFVVGYRPPISGAPEQNEYRGFLFRVPSHREDAR